MTISQPNTLVSIVIPFYNCEKYISETLQSIGNQTYANIEIIVVNDGSQSSSTDYLKELLSDKKHIQYIYQENKGPSAARNAGGKVAKGEYLVFLDADDLIHPEYLQKTLESFNLNSNCKLVYTGAQFFEAQSGEWVLQPYVDFRSLLLNNRIPCYALHKTTDFVALNGFDENLNALEDWDYWIRLLKNGGEVVKLPEILFSYRKRWDGSSLLNMLSNNPDMNKRSWQVVYDKHKELYLQHGLSFCDLSSEINQQREQLCIERQKIQEQQERVKQLLDEIHSMKQERQSMKFRLKKLEKSISSAGLMGSSISISGFEQLRQIYKSPNYQIIRAIKRLNWKLRKRPKKPYFYPNNEQQCKSESIKILWSPGWNILGPIHAIYALFSKK